MDPIDLITAHRYSEALARYEAQLRIRPDDDASKAGRALALLCLGQRLEEALDEFRETNEAERAELEELGGKSQPELEHIGTVLWLLGRRREAIETFRSGAEGIRDGTIEFGDLAGGASHGLLLWYSGVTAGDSTARDFALKCLAELAERNRRDYPLSSESEWPFPGPVALCLLGRMKPADMLVGLVGTADPDEAVCRARERSGDHKGIWHWVVQALFYAAAMERAAGREAECKTGMARCASIENPITAVEWYLARAEAGYVPGRRDWAWQPAGRIGKSRGHKKS